MQFESRVAIAGMRLKSTPEDVRSLPLTSTGIVIDGAAVAIADTGETCTAVTAEATDFGIVVFQHVGKSGKTTDAEAEAYIKGDTLPIMTQGRIWVKPNEAIVARGKAAKVYVNASTGTLGKTATGNTELLGAFWDVPTNADGLAIVNLG